MAGPDGTLFSGRAKSGLTFIRDHHLNQSANYVFDFKNGIFCWQLYCFLIEVFIAVFVNDKIIRPYVGDFLVVILIYCSVQSLIKLPDLKLSLLVALFASAIEVSQYFNFVDRLGLGNFKIARVVLGTSFAWMDLVAYTLGILVVIGVERLRRSGNQERLRSL